jgi:AcrR family transcriptional regulator
VRSDTRRNIRSLLKAAGEEMESNPAAVTLQSIAARAGIGKATAYRYFSSLAESSLAGADLFRAVLGRWVELVLEHGNVMVQLRSRSGYLERLDREDQVITASRTIWERPVTALLDESGLSADLQRYALFLCNALSDPREILDLHNNAGMSSAQIVADVEAALRGALDGWSRSLETPGP